MKVIEIFRSRQGEGRMRGGRRCFCGWPFVIYVVFGAILSIPGVAVLI